jgi:hypothetical protein
VSILRFASVFTLSAYDDDSYMLGEATYRPAAKSHFHDWRFGSHGVPHVATCGGCGRKTDAAYVSPTFRVRHRDADLVATYDGYLLASKRLRDRCLEQGSPGARFVLLPGDDAFYWVCPDRIVTFDAVARGTRFEHPCAVCGAFYSVVGATPARLSVDDTGPLDGFFRTDLEFGSGPEQSFLVVVAGPTATLLRDGIFRGLSLKAIAT